MNSLLSNIKPLIDQAVKELVYSNPKKPKAVVAKAINLNVRVAQEGAKYDNNETN